MQAYEIAKRNNILQVDEIHREEDYEPLGFNYITLGLADVLLDPVTMDVFTPNTGQTKNLKTGEERAEDIELRFNPNHDERGRFASGGGGGAKVHFKVDPNMDSKSELFGSKVHSGGQKSSKGIDKSSQNGVEYGTGEVKNDFNGNPYTYPELHLPKKEYGTIIRQIDDKYDTIYDGKSIGYHSTPKHTYKFEIRGYNDYNIFAKWEND